MDNKYNNSNNYIKKHKQNNNSYKNNKFKYYNNYINKNHKNYISKNHNNYNKQTNNIIKNILEIIKNKEKLRIICICLIIIIILITFLCIFIKEESSLPIYEQIVSAVKNSILNHELAPGDMLPSIRSLAKSLGISVITTKRAYEELEKQGLIYSEQGKGFFVSRFNPNILLEEQLKTLEDHLADVVLEAKTLNLSAGELTDMVRLLWDKEVQ